MGIKNSGMCISDEETSVHKSHALADYPSVYNGSEEASIASAEMLMPRISRRWSRRENGDTCHTKP